MNKISKLLLVILTLIIAFVLLVHFFYDAKNNKKDKYELININELTKNFVDDYFKQLHKSNTKEAKAKMLIVISKNEIKNSYGAKNIIKAPNNQFILQYDSIKAKNNALNKLKDDTSILSVQENIVYRIENTEYNSWGIQAMSLDYAINSTNAENLQDVKVAIIDTGCDVELFNKYYNGKILETYNVLDETTNVNDESGHGTHISGTIAEGTPSNVKIIPIKVSGSGYDIYDTDVIAAINYITYYDKADVVNLSLGSYLYSEAQEQAIEAARQKNIISVAAAGNDNTSALHYPSSLDNTISIAAVDSSLNKSTFSNYGSTITFAAPGTGIKSIMGKDTKISKKYNNSDDDDHETINGTSMATPHAVSAVAILKGYNKDLNLEDVIDLLKSHSIDLGTKGWDWNYGYGLISFDNSQFCDGNNCDQYNVFKMDDNAVTNIEISEVTFADYNYWTENNIYNTEIKIYYNDSTIETKRIGELDRDKLEIKNYDPYSNAEQNIQVKYSGITINVTVPEHTDLESAYEYQKLDDESIELTLYKGDSNYFNTLYIPEKIDGYDVVSLAGESSIMKSKVFSSAEDYVKFKEIILPKTLNNIGKRAFIGSKLKKVTSLSTGVKIHEEAFFNVSTLELFEGTISLLDSHSFSGAELLDNVVLSDGISEIPKGAFSNCKSLEHINMPYDLVSIGKSAFSGDYKLRDVTLPHNLKSIGDNAFSDTGIEKVSFPYSLTEIGKEAFYGTNIRELSISRYLITIGEAAFENCKSLERINVDKYNSAYDSRDNSNALIETSTNTLLKGTNNTIIPKTVTKIDAGAFLGDLKITEIEIPDNVVEIGKGAFKNCNYLTLVKIPRSVNIIGIDAFKIYPVDREEFGYNQIPLTILTYNDAYAKTYAVENEINYDTMNPSFISVNDSIIYVAGSTIESDSLGLKLYYDYGYLNNSNYYEKSNENGKVESVNDNYEISYQHGNTLKFGDEWYLISGTNKYGIHYEKKVNITVEKYAVTFYKNDGSENKIIQNGIDSLSEFALSKNKFIREGYTFIGWNIIPNSSEILYLDEQVVSIDNNLILYAIWEKNSYEINFYKNDGTQEKITYNREYNDELQFYSLFNLEKYDFVYWEDVETKEKYYINDSINIRKNMNFNAIWEQNAFDVIFDPYGDNTNVTTRRVLKNNNVLLYPCTKEGYKFLGWKDIDTEIVYPDKQYVTFEKDIHLVGVWEEDTNPKLIIKNNVVILNVNATKKTITNLLDTTDDIKVFDGENELSETTKLATGNTLKINDVEYPIAILGDANKDGKVTGSDVALIYSKYKGAVTIDEVQTLAADVNEDGIVTGSDISYAYSLYKQN